MADIISFPKYRADTPVLIMAYKDGNSKSGTCTLKDHRKTLTDRSRGFLYDRADVLDLQDRHKLLVVFPTYTEFFDKDVENLFLSLHRETCVMVAAYEDAVYYDYTSWTENCALKESYNVILNRLKTRPTDDPSITADLFYVWWNGNIIYKYEKGEVKFWQYYADCEKYVHMPRK